MPEDITEKLELADGHYITALIASADIESAKQKRLAYQAIPPSTALTRKKTPEGREPKNYYGYYALRDAEGNTHATLILGHHKHASESLDYCIGENELPPKAQYMPYIKEFVRQRKCKLGNTIANTGLILAKSESGEEKLYDIYEFPNQTERLTLVGYHRNGEEVFNFKHISIPKLPENLTVPGSLELDEMPIANLKGLKVAHTLRMNKTKITQGENITIGPLQPSDALTPKKASWAKRSGDGWFKGGKTKER